MRPPRRPAMVDLLVARGLVVTYAKPSGLLARGPATPPVLHGVDISVGKGETVGIGTLGERARRPLRRRMQMIFQDPMSSLNPRHTIGRILIEPTLLHGLANDRAAALALVHGVLDRVGLSRSTVDRYSYELSGGQRQRVGIARAVVLRPDFVLADEIVSGLDVSTQAQVLRLLQELTREMHLALAFISHDLSVVRSICQRVVVMREGRVVEEGICEQVFAAPAAAYTRMLIDAIPLPSVDPGWLTRGVAAEAAATA